MPAHTLSWSDALEPIRLNYSAAYAFADHVISSVYEPSGHKEDGIVADFFAFGSKGFFRKVSKPQKETILHDFIFFINYESLERHLGKHDGEVIVNDYKWLLLGADIPVPSWFVEDEVEAHLPELGVLVEESAKKITASTFQLLFADRTFLFSFNKMVSYFVATLQPEDDSCIARPGVVHRSNVPTWLKNAVFHRDKGHCQICGENLTNCLVPARNLHYDHMVPLGAGGTNDPTNFQLTCGRCNTSKGAAVYAEDHLTFPYW